MNQNELQASHTDTNLNDLSVTEAEQAEIKGGPKRIFIGGLSVNESQTALLDLEPQGDVKGGCNPIYSTCGPIGNHNETLESDYKDSQDEQSLTDLEPQGEVKGGSGSTVWSGPIRLDSMNTTKPATIRNESLTLNGQG